MITHLRQSSLSCITSLILIAFALLLLQEYDHSNSAKALISKYPEVGVPSPKGPTISDSNVKAQQIFKGLKYPTSIAFLGPNDVLVTEKDAGTVRRIINGIELQQPLLNVSVATSGHRGMLAMAITPHVSSTTADLNPNSNHNNNSTTTNAYVFLYYTQAQTNTGDDIRQGKQPLGNRLYRYELNNNKLVNPKLLLDLPASPGSIGNGGKIVIGPDNNIYVTIGDVGINR